MNLIRKYYIDEDPGGGGEPKAPAAPKGYAVTTPQQRTEWNGFLDYLDKQGVAGKPDLDAPGAGLKYFQQYKKANPAISLTPEHIQNIQYEQSQIRKGDQFSGLNKMQLDHLRSGLSPAYLNRPLSEANGQINAATSKLYYPAGKSYGTDIEHYDSALGQPTPAAPVAANAPTNTPTPVATPPPIATPANGGVPSVYANHDSALQRAHALAAIPGNDFIKGRADTMIHAGYVPDTDTKSLKDSSAGAAKALGIDPAMFYASAAEEGMTGLVPDKKGNINTGDESHVDLNGKYPVDGFTNFGLDHFHDQFKELVKRGYLPKDFDYQKATIKNPENGEVVNSGNFKSVEDATKAKAAFVRMEKDNLGDWSKTNNVQLSPAANQFFTFVAYNGGPGTAHKMINYYKKNGLLEGDKFLQQAPPKEVDRGDSYGKVLPRWKMAQLLKSEKIIE